MVVIIIHRPEKVFSSVRLNKWNKTISKVPSFLTFESVTHVDSSCSHPSPKIQSLPSFFLKEICVINI